MVQVHPRKRQASAAGSRTITLAQGTRLFMVHVHEAGGRADPGRNVRRRSISRAKLARHVRLRGGAGWCRGALCAT